MHREVSRSGVTPWPTRVGWAVATAAIFIRLMSAHGTVAIGALLALGLLMVVDYLVSLASLYRRPATLSVGRTRIAAPNEFQLTIDAPKGPGHLHLIAARFDLFANDSEFCTLRSDETTQTIALPSASWGRSKHLRFRSDLSIIGLVSARRWTTQIVPELCLVPEAVNQDADLVGVDEVGRLREYVPGDRMGMVSWGTTARTGQLHVRAAAPEADEIVVVVDLGTSLGGLSREGRTIDYTVSQAFGVGEDLLAQGRTFRLIATEMIPAFDVERRELALASPWRRARPKLDHRPGEDTEFLYRGSPATRVSSSTIYDRDELIRRLSAVDMSAPIPRPAGPYIEVTPAGVRSVS